ncbi:hypothetical protein [Streptomyces alkaliterrae]|uniref:Uncharacterized protein n=1 Tax=Streptomyces alkaliterrae TaxID=2213162 RepID=A0A5P0YYZ6_9ACTN|nr:hypothetical protein [Streptomyces alkaliterrae]MBB1254257.1 hypothetical protein [Streptomyces alkaliterrae]MBB1259620.1 hypothetical protein [Streptomyces alkaliterrae]MQS05250.1 hypothetical protein [Streptomyces alkaliterrae]
MRIPVVTITDDRRAAPPPPGLSDILWALASPRDGIEHIHVAPAPGRALITYFLRAADDHTALGTARLVTDRAISHSPALRGWRRL